jgi:hypothetical protein
LNRVADLSRAQSGSEHLAINAYRGSWPSSLDDIAHSTQFNLLKGLGRLINGWCQRRALRPLAYLLPAYPAVLAHANQEFQLLEALKNLKRFCIDDLTPEELRLVTQAHDFLDERLRACVI